jgi:hypothetical protein
MSTPTEQSDYLLLFRFSPNRVFRRDAGSCTRGRAAVSRVPACGHVAAAYAAHGGKSTRSRDALPEPIPKS